MGQHAVRHRTKSSSTTSIIAVSSSRCRPRGSRSQRQCAGSSFRPGWLNGSIPRGLLDQVVPLRLSALATCGSHAGVIAEASGQLSSRASKAATEGTGKSMFGAESFGQCGQ